ncbi:MAG: cohesin domain-containing protein [Minisyncoccia bacterium]
MTLHFRIYLSASLAAVFFLLPSAALAATLGLSPANTTVGIGSIITETVWVSSADQAMNAIDGTISFPSDLLQVVSVSKGGSVLSLWVQDPTFSNTNGSISFSGVVPNPGYTGSRGQVLSIQFRGKRAGTATVEFLSSSQVLANDGNGTDILSGTQSSTLTVVPASQPEQTPSPAKTLTTSASNVSLLAHITSSSHPDQIQWYSLSHAIFDWTNAQNISAIRLGYDENANGSPSVVYSDPISHKELDIADGISYFHVQEKGSGGWGPVSSYRVQIDTVPPLPFTVSFPQGTTSPAGSPVSALFTASDELSGIDHYQVTVDGKDSVITTEEGNHLYAVSAGSGSHTLLVRAYDRAGNSTLADGRFFVAEGAPKPSPFDLFTFGWLAVNYFSIILIILAILITLLFAAWYIRTHFTAYRHRLNHRLGLTNAHVHKEFDTLKDAVNVEMLAFERAKSKRDLTREEARFITRFRKLLDQSELAIERDIEDLPK